MLITQHKAMPSISAANPLPSAFWQAKFRCRAARRNAIQAVDILGLFSIEAAFLRDPLHSFTGGATRAAIPRPATAALFRARGRTGYGRRRCHRSADAPARP